LATAQQLPNLPYFGVVGTIGSDEVLDLYRLHLNEGIGGLDFRLAAHGADPNASIQFMILDGSGEVLATSSSGGQIDSTLHLSLGGLPAGTTLFLGISVSDPAGAQPTPGPTSYQVWVDRQPAPGRPSDTLSIPSNLLSVAVSALLASPVVSLAAAGLPAGRESDPVGTPAPPTSNALATNVAVGSLAIRWALPSAGLLSEGDAAASSPGEPATSLAQDWSGASRSGLPVHSAGLTKTDASGDQAGEREVVALVPGPGGFPLLGATAVGHGRRRSAGIEEAPIVIPPTQNWTQGIDEPTERLDLQASLLPGEIEAAGAHSLRTHSWARFPVSLFSGLGIATVLTLNALLSQPIAGFDYLTSRFDALARGKFAGRGKRRPSGSR
jgi:hypothetical protein